ncbi:MAG: amino acid adenylation domain-containing protein, partial [Deltaproteobacteria bacterium]|nr:amino acid adenylation domain-containing protein [Deltaproteobacteria bacterium]
MSEKTVISILRDLKNKGIILWVEGDSLKYKAPEGVMNKKIISLLKERKSELIHLLKEIKLSSSYKSNKIEKVDRSKKIFPMTYGQRSMWYYDQLQKGNPVYNIINAIKINGNLELSILDKVLKTLVDRHESLRTVFSKENEIPSQKILNDIILNVEIEEVPSVDNINDFLENRLKVEVLKEFDLEKGPLLKILLLKFGNDESILSLTTHHIISDAWSNGIFIREFISLYDSLVKDKEIKLGKIDYQFVDYTLWQNKWLEDPSVKTIVDYWREKLENPPVLELSTDYPRPPELSFSGGFVPVSIDEKIVAKINDICNKKKITPFVFLLSVFKIFLYRYSNQNDISVGTVVANRSNMDIQNIIGYFMNTLVLRSSISNKNTFIEYLNQVKDVTLEAFRYQDVPFDKLLEELNPVRDKARTPYFQTMFIFHTTEKVDLKLSRLEIEEYEIHSGMSPFDLRLQLTEKDNIISGALDYNSSIFTKETVERMVENFLVLLDSAVHDIGLRISDIEIISKEERQKILSDFNDKEIIYPKDKTIINLFEEQVEKTPENIAVVFENIELTYRQLNEKANMVGYYLRDNFDVMPDDFVGVLLGRSEKMIIALLGILKAGAAYVPIDPEYPKDRIEYMIEDSSPKVVLSESNIKHINNDFVDINEVLISTKKTANLNININPNNYIYAIYTSGSTGRPKGSVIRHVNFINLINWFTTDYVADQNENFLILTSYSFDLTQKNFYAPLVVGGVLFLSSAKLFDPNFILFELSNHKIKNLNCTPRMFDSILQMDENNNYKNLITLRKVFLGGEQIDLIGLNKWNSSGRCHAKIFNTYGPTECTDICLSHELDWRVDTKTVPLGTPISNNKIFITNEYLNIIPIGVSGELCISGVGLGRGYLNKPELTAEKFVENPYLPEERMYRTGDLAKWLPDGNIEFLGRIDDQVKLRGFRIELGEIENSLLQHVNISSAVVLAQEEIVGDQQLIAYFVSDKELEFAELRSFLSKSLPDYMIPSFFVFMEQLPLTPNGKIDKKSLPEVDRSINSQVEYVAPWNEIQEKLVWIWQEVLGIERIGILDNIFELGGHSLKATRVVSQIIKELEVDISLRDIFSNPTIESLGNVINLSAKKKYKQIEPVSKKESYKVSNAQKRLWILDQIERYSIAYNMPSVFCLHGVFDGDSFKKAYSYILERHESLRTVFVTSDGNPEQKVLEELDFNMEITDLRESADKEIEAKKIVEMDMLTPFDLSTGSLVRFGLIRLEEERFIVYFNMHHIISDGWSMNILTRDFLLAYNSFRRNQVPDQKPLRIHYKDFSVWQNELLESPNMEKQGKYWLDKLDGELPVLDFPSDKVRPAVQTFNGNHIQFTLSKDIKSQLNGLCSRNHVSLFMLLQALVK